MSLARGRSDATTQNACPCVKPKVLLGSNCSTHDLNSETPLHTDAVDLDAWSQLAATGFDLNTEQRWFHTSVLHPTFLRILQQQRPSTILDFGAGRGHLSEMLRAHGWKPDLYEPAKGMLLPPPAGRCFTSADSLPVAKYDCVVANLVVSAMPSVGTAMDELTRPLSPGGLLVMSVPHPCFSLIDELHSTTERSWERAASNPALGSLGRYLRRDRQRVRWSPGGPETTLYHRPVSVYTNHLRKAGLRLEELLEPVGESADNAGPLDGAFLTLPPFLVIVARAA
jgi:SAM-dependent methyltransferase